MLSEIGNHYPRYSAPESIMLEKKHRFIVNIGISKIVCI